MVTPASATNLKVPPEILETLRRDLAAGRAELIHLAEHMAPTRGVELVTQTTDLVDGIVERLSRAALEALGKGHVQAEQVAVVAVGGYGRRELCPRSDIDLLFLLPRSRPSEHVIQYVNAILYGLWDLGFEVGHAVRSVEECIDIAQQDQAVKTGLLDARLLNGGEGGENVRRTTYQNLTRTIERELLSGKGAGELIEQKLDEAKKRRERFGNSIYLLEPNVKASEGGLRELHTALWVARARWRAVGTRDLLRFGVLSPREGRVLDRAYGFLLRVRTELHHLANRRQDSLSFEHQELIAKTLGYVRGKPGDGQSEHEAKRQGVERFMRKYYFHARQIRVLCSIIIERATSNPQSHPATAVRAPGGFKVWGGTLTVAERDQFQRDPGALVRIFRVAQEEALEIYSYTKDLIQGSSDAIDAQVRRSAPVVKDFLAILEDPKSDGTILNQMHDLSVLRRIMPEVLRVTARWQHSLYHVYTVDVHSLFVVQHLKLLRSGGYAREQPELTRLIAELLRPNVLYMAGFLHDIGKGWPKVDHSKKGAEVARAVGRRFEAARIPNWTEEDTADLVWLVREHLRMSDISQRRDVSDHDLIQSFAESCATVERLTMLYLLTFADMKGTSPKVWSDWKGTLLREVFEVTRMVLEGGRAGRDAHELGSQHLEARRQRVTQEILHEAREREVKTVSEASIHEFTARMSPRYMLSVPTRRMLRHVEMWREVNERGGFQIHVRQLRREGTTKLTIVCPDRPGLLALLAGTMAANRLQILSAQIFSMEAMPEKQAMAVDILFLKDESGEICEDPDRWARVRADLSAVLAGDGDVKTLLDQRVRGSTLKEKKKPEVKTEIVVANEVSKSETVIDIFCQDRLGVLYTISRALADAGLTISVAKISTQGDRVADGFYVTDAATRQKIVEKERLEAIRDGVRAAIEDASTSSPSAAARP